MKTENIKWELTIAYNSHENDVAECKNWSLLNIIISILADFDLSQNLWSELIDTAAYLKNQSSIKHLKDKISHKMLHDKKSNFAHLRIISCSCWAQISDKKQEKLNFKSKECWLLDYKISMQFILYDVKDKHVIFL